MVVFRSCSVKQKSTSVGVSLVSPTQVFFCEFCKIFKSTFLQSSSKGCLWKWCHHNLADHFEDCSKVPLNLDFHDCFWKLNLMSNICEVKSQISKCNLQSNAIHHSPYQMTWIWYRLHQALGIFFCKFYMLSIKFNYAASFSPLKLFKSWFHPSGEIVWPFGNFFVSFLCFRLFNISSICSRHVFDPVKWKVRDFFATAFHSVFCSVSHRQVFTLIIVRSKAIACIWKFFSLVVFSCLYCSWSIYYPELTGV